jgi:peptidoglycan/xylan/chitin deacetylase (PgdA/CDA1 family)
MLRYHAAQLVDRLRIPSAVLALRAAARVPAWITVLAYHRVNDATAGADFDEGTVDVTPEAFDRHVAYAKRWFDVIGVGDLLAYTRGGALPRNPLLITFDDGYKDNWRAAVPILRKHGATATFFIATTYVSDRRLFWWDRLNYMVKRSPRAAIEIDYPTRLTVPLGGAGGGSQEKYRRRAFETLRKVITSHFKIDLWRFLDAVAEGSGVVLSREDERRLADDMILTWDEVRAMRRAGMDIQSHTRDHYVLPTMTDEHLAAELGGSREILEGVLGEPVRAISYPVGHRIPAALRKAVRHAGYELGFTNASGINHRWSFDPLDVRRLSLELGSPDGYFKTVLAIPYTSY